MSITRFCKRLKYVDPRVNEVSSIQMTQTPVKIIKVRIVQNLAADILELSSK